MAAVVELRNDFGSSDLRALAKTSRVASQDRRLLALAEIHDGGSRTDTARIGSVGLQTVRDWVVRFNATGPDGLIDGKAPGNAAKLRPASHPELLKCSDDFVVKLTEAPFQRRNLHLQVVFCDHWLNNFHRLAPQRPGHSGRAMTGEFGLFVPTTSPTTLSMKAQQPRRHSAARIFPPRLVCTGLAGRRERYCSRSRGLLPRDAPRNGSRPGLRVVRGQACRMTRNGGAPDDQIKDPAYQA